MTRLKVLAIILGAAVVVGAWLLIIDVGLDRLLVRLIPN
jgi:hypothetical protein